MLSSANLNVTDTLRLFKSAGLKVSFLVPTATGLAKSIMDATAGIDLKCNLLILFSLSHYHRFIVTSDVTLN